MDVSEAHQLPSQDGFVPPQHDSTEVPDQCVLGSIETKSAAFMQCVTEYFGQHSPEWNTISQALNEFKSGLLSKREAWSAMMEILREHDDLRNDLFAVLGHQDAKRGSEDFFLEPLPWTPIQQSPPQYVTNPQQLVGDYNSSSAMPEADMFRPTFRQPQHQPQMRMTSLDVGCTTSPYAMPQTMPLDVLATSPALLRSSPLHDLCDHTGLTSYQGAQNSPNVGPSGRDGCDMPVTFETQWPNLQQPIDPFPSTGTFSNTLPFPAEDVMAQSLTSSSTVPMMGSPFAKTSYAMECEFTHKQVSELLQRDSSSYYNVSEAGDTHRGWRNATASGFEGPQLTNFEHTFYTATLPGPHLKPNPVLPSSPGWTTSLTVPNSDTSTDTMAPPPRKRGFAPNAIPSSGLPQVDTQVSPQPRKISAVGGPFIHGICGKTFTTRRSVKKHHWGSGKADDIYTRTGCWAKHGKPNRAWDEHPSCKVDTPKSRITKTARGKSNTSMAPGKTPAPLHTEPGFPMSEGFAIEGAATTAPYHNHTVPYMSNLATSDDTDSLLTVVNAVAKVDAPTPQGRNDSVAAYLDAQATAAEQDGRAGTSSEAPALLEKDGEEVVSPLSLGAPHTERKA